MTLPLDEVSKQAAELRLDNERILKRLELEIWVSSQNRHERHYFRRGGQHGYQDGQYIWGYNPEVVSPEQVEQILAILNASTAA